MDRQQRQDIMNHFDKIERLIEHEIRVIERGNRLLSQLNENFETLVKIQLGEFELQEESEETAIHQG